MINIIVDEKKYDPEAEDAKFTARVFLRADSVNIPAEQRDLEKYIVEQVGGPFYLGEMSLIVIREKVTKIKAEIIAKSQAFGEIYEWQNSEDQQTFSVAESSE
ncbi:MAG: hypothetical protein U9Q96_00605 [Patescibacteria group bacterium]|nr:hypothetical protein [Patescibacteria group bacterium]